jgi:phosphate-selective porin OprO/OprP
VERALPTNLVPNRDLGIQLGGETADGVLSYQAGIFNGVPDGGSADLDVNDNKETDARVFLHPFRRGAGPLWGLGVGVSGTYGTNRGTTTTTGLAPYRTTGQQTFFSYLAESGNTVVAAGTRSRISPQGYFYSGRFGLMAEYVRSRQEVAKGTSQADLSHASWQTTASFLLTDDKAGYKQTAPKSPYDGTTRGPGAWEIKARYSQLDVDEDAFPVYANPAASARKAKAWGVGVNWYLSRNVKAVIDGEWTKFDGGAGGGTGVTDRGDERVLFSRFQVAL